MIDYSGYGKKRVAACQPGTMIKPPDGLSADDSEEMIADERENFEQCMDGEDEETLEDLFQELDGMIGLSNVKIEMNKLIQFVKIQDMRRKQKLSTTNPVLHSVFTGSPGTGKTTVARIYGRMLKALGLLPRGHLIETDRSGMVANYVGQTATKTDAIINEAMGGVLFIDEAYSLCKGQHSNNDYGPEAIEILVKRMEDYREKFAVIVAGYPDPMRNFLNSNEGFRSRFTSFIHFDDYAIEELRDIFYSIVSHANYILVGKSGDRLDALIRKNYDRRDGTFGNGRFCRNLFESIIRNQAVRIGSSGCNPTCDQLIEILPEDIPV